MSPAQVEPSGIRHVSRGLGPHPLEPRARLLGSAAAGCGPCPVARPARAEGRPRARRVARGLSASDPDAAARAAERALRGLAGLVGGFCVLAAALLARACQLDLRHGRLPPAGWWSLGAQRAATGSTAARLARLGLALAAALALVGVTMALAIGSLLELSGG